MKRLVHELRLLLLALQFLTRVPAPAWVGFEAAWLPASARHFPLVGAFVGAWAALVLALASLLWPPAVAAVLAVAATVWLTGGLHEDGLADTCDGLGGAVDRARALQIMKDPHLGAYGVLGLVVTMALRVAVLTALLTPQIQEVSQAEGSLIHQVLLGWTMLALVWAHATSRLAPVLLMRGLPYAGLVDRAKAPPMALGVSAGTLVGAGLAWLAVAMALWVGVGLGGWPARTLAEAMALSGAAALGVTALAAWRFSRRLGGYTGDTLGAVQQCTELAALLAWLALVHPVPWVRWW